MEHHALVAPEALRHSIRDFWYWDMELGAAAPFEVMPDGHAEIIFHFGDGCSLIHSGEETLLPSPYIVGLLQQPVYFSSPGRLQVIGIKCLPWAIYDLLELPSVRGGVQSFSHPIASLQSELAALVAADKIDQALLLLRDWFLERNRVVFSELNKAGDAMLASGGTLPVSSIAEAAHATVRTLERRFKASSGHTIKDVSGLIRFEQARDHLWAHPTTRISTLAHELGYADQSHLNREFKRYSGMTAAAFARRKHDLGNDFVAIILSS